MNKVGVVAIGRNEGVRLERCLNSLVGQSRQVVYVDSGSTDRSVAIARSRGVDVVELPRNAKFTAARARNAGLSKLSSEVEFVQFVDGDCEVYPYWLSKAAVVLAQNPDVVVVCGRRRERFPSASVYNLLCDMEWDTPIGPAKACGGDAMIRVSAIKAAGGYDDGLIAGEEPELCVRLRATGGNILRIDADMTLHDADMHRFGQWWRRNVRNGHAFAEGAAMHGNGPDRHWARETRSNWIWGLIVPVVAIVAVWPTWGLSLLILALYPIQAFRIFRHGRHRGWPVKNSLLYSVFCTLGKFPQVIGQIKYRLRTLQGIESQLIEYKTAASPAGMERN